MSKMIGLSVAFVGIVVILFLGVSMISEIPAPEAGDEGYDTYENLTDVVDLSFTGMQAVLLLFVVIILITAVYTLKIRF